MAWRIVKQPNGKLARFSDIVDHFTDYNMNKEEAYELCCYEMGVPGAEKKVQSGIDDIEPWTVNVKGDGLSRWRDCLKSIEMVHGEEELKRVEEELGR